MRYAKLRSPSGEVFVQLDGPNALPLDRPPWEAGSKPVSQARAWTASDLACPVLPSKIVCVGRNYAAHAKELGNEVPAEPLLFFKPPSSLTGPDGVVVLPPESARVEHEAELGVIIGRRTRLVQRDEAATAVFGCTCVCDITARDLQKKDGQWTRAKGFDTFCPVGPWIETAVDTTRLGVVCRVNGDVRQDGSTSQMIFDVPTLIAYISRVMTLEPGDLVVTGTPEGVGPLARGDALEVEVERVGVLRVRVA
jgi:2-keto-4-pentenoate hydratase/2-oxohepta-3-ene-1,7-dioic acid hydratase in catechol pathway